MQNKTLTALYLNYNNIGDLGLQHLLTALKENKCANPNPNLNPNTCAASVL